MANTSTWEPLAAEELVDLLAGVQTPWWLAGGVALDLFVGHPTRHHHDLDVEIPRAGLDALIGHLRGWDPHTAHNAALRRLHNAAEQPQEANGVWWRREPTTPWCLDLKLAHVVAGEWLYRRCPAIRRPLASLWWTSPGGLPVIAPEVQLLFKARIDRTTDTDDASAVVPLLDIQARRWLIDAIRLAHPESPWLDWL